MQLENLSALELGELVNNKVISPTEVMQYFLRRITDRNPSINAFVYVEAEDAMNEAKILEKKIMEGIYGGPFAGVPVALKDFLPTKKGWKASHGGVPSLITVDEYDSEFYKACKNLGAIAVGKTNAPSFGFRGVTDNVMYGPTSTPFDTRYNSAGSSGGSASAVADGLVYIAEGGDAGGSTRLPSAWCGTFGFKPSAGLVPSVCRPDAWTATHPYCCGGPITRTVKDAAIIMNQMQDYNPRDPLSVPLQQKMFNVRRSIRDLKIAITYDFDLFPDPESPIKEALDNAAKKLMNNGAKMDFVHFDFSYSKEEYENAWLRGISIDTGIEMELWKQNGYDLAGDHTDEVPDKFLYWSKLAFDSNMMNYYDFHKIRTSILDAHQDVFDHYDVIIAPVTGCMPVLNNTCREVCTEGPKFINGVEVDPLIGFGYTYLENMIGTPAASVPIGTYNNLPIGLQVIGQRYRDEDVFTVAYALEQLNPWNYDIPFSRKVEG